MKQYDIETHYGRSPSGPGATRADALPEPQAASRPSVTPPIAYRTTLTTAERAVSAYATIEAFGWDIHWRGKKPVPDDAWPIDIIRRAINAELIAFANDLNTLKWMGSDDGWELAIEAVRKHLYERAQGIVTEGQDPQGLGEREARVEPGPKDAPEIGIIPVTTVKVETL